MLHNRRTIFLGATALASLSAAGAAAQIWPFRRRADPQPIPAQHQEHSGHSGHDGHAASDIGLSGAESEVIHTLAHCEMTGQACLTHCLSLLAQGDSSMAACASGVREMLSVCQATTTLIQSRSSLAAAQLAVCRDACAACRAACLPHVDHHAQCSECAQACTHAIAAIEALMA
jgi:Cys-rich four helix bundle protein (predicted Tat secretion target)